MPLETNSNGNRSALIIDAWDKKEPIFWEQMQGVVRTHESNVRVGRALDLLREEMRQVIGPKSLQLPNELKAILQSEKSIALMAALHMAQHGENPSMSKNQEKDARIAAAVDAVCGHVYASLVPLVVDLAEPNLGQSIKAKDDLRRAAWDAALATSGVAKETDQIAPEPTDPAKPSAPKRRGGKAKDVSTTDAPKSATKPAEKKSATEKKKDKEKPVDPLIAQLREDYEEVPMEEFIQDSVEKASKTPEHRIALGQLIAANPDLKTRMTESIVKILPGLRVSLEDVQTALAIEHKAWAKRMFHEVDGDTINTLLVAGATEEYVSNNVQGLEGADRERAKKILKAIAEGDDARFELVATLREWVEQALPKKKRAQKKVTGEEFTAADAASIPVQEEATPQKEGKMITYVDSERTRLYDAGMSGLALAIYANARNFEKAAKKKIGEAIEKEGVQVLKDRLTHGKPIKALEADEMEYDEVA